MVVRPGPAYSVADVARGWVRGLNACGIDVYDVNYDDRLAFFSNALRSAPGYEWADRDPVQRAAHVAHLASHDIRADVYDTNPDLILVISGFFVSPDFYAICRSRGWHTVVLLCTESPYEDSRQLLRAPHADIVILNDPTNLEQFRAFNPNTHYVPHAYDPSVHHPTCQRRVRDFAFVGTGYPSRIEFFEKVDWDGISATFAGSWGVEPGSPLAPFLHEQEGEGIENRVAADLYRTSRINANLYRKEADNPDLSAGWAMGPREVELAATRSFFLREPRGEGDELFPFLPTFTEPGEFTDLLRHYKDLPDTRNELARRAQAAVADRTFTNNARRLLALVEKESHGT